MWGWLKRSSSPGWASFSRAQIPPDSWVMVVEDREMTRQAVTNVRDWTAPVACVFGVQGRVSDSFQLSSSIKTVSSLLLTQGGTSIKW